MDVIVQHVRTTWTKRSRGLPLAGVRNAAPVAFVLPPGGPPLFHDVRMDEEDGFAPRESVRHEPPPASVAVLRLTGKVLRVQVPNGFGAPERQHRPVVLLHPGQWLRWRLNNRYSSATGMSGWHYSLTTLSIAFGPVAPDAFLGQPPHVVDELAALR